MIEYICVLDFANKLDKRNWTIWAKLQYWIWKSSFVNDFHYQETIIESLVQLHAHKSIPSCNLVPVEKVYT